MDVILVLKLAGAVLALAAGIWIGLGMPGHKSDPPPSRGRPIDRLNATWMNRMFFKMSARPRRFDVGRLAAPPGAGQKKNADAAEDEAADEPEDRIVRLRRR